MVIGDRLIIDGSGNSQLFQEHVQLQTQFTATNGALNYLKRNTDASLQLRSENTRFFLVYLLHEPATNTVMGSAYSYGRVESYRFGTANYYHQVMLQDGNIRICNCKYVGIGDTSPLAKLEVAWNI